MNKQIAADLDLLKKMVKMHLALLMERLGTRAAADNGTRGPWGRLSTIPFIYIVWELFRGVAESIGKQPENVGGLVKNARLLTFASWGFYPIVYTAPFAGISGASAKTTIQIGYTVADIVSKVSLGILIYLISTRESAADAGDDEVHA